MEVGLNSLTGKEKYLESDIIVTGTNTMLTETDTEITETGMEIVESDPEISTTTTLAPPKYISCVPQLSPLPENAIDQGSSLFVALSEENPKKLTSFSSKASETEDEIRNPQTGEACIPQSPIPVNDKSPKSEIMSAHQFPIPESHNSELIDAHTLELTKGHNPERTETLDSELTETTNSEVPPVNNADVSEVEDLENSKTHFGSCECDDYDSESEGGASSSLNRDILSDMAELQLEECSIGAYSNNGSFRSADHDRGPETINRQSSRSESDLFPAELHKVVDTTPDDTDFQNNANKPGNIRDLLLFGDNSVTTENFADKQPVSASENLSDINEVSYCDKNADGTVFISTNSNVAEDQIYDTPISSHVHENDSENPPHLMNEGDGSEQKFDLVEEMEWQQKDLLTNFYNSMCHDVDSNDSTSEDDVYNKQESTPRNDAPPNKKMHGDAIYSYVTNPPCRVRDGMNTLDCVSNDEGSKNLADINDRCNETPATTYQSEDQITWDKACYANEPIYESIDEPSNRKRKSKCDSRSSRSSRSSHSSSLSGPWSEERLYEDIHDAGPPPPCLGGSSLPAEVDDAPPWTSRRLQGHRPLSSSDSWGSEEFESYSSEEDKTMPQSNGPGNFKQRLLKKREQWRERRQSNRNMKFSLRKDSKENKEPKDVDADNDSQVSVENRGLSRWFSMRKSNYNMDRKSTLPDRTSSSSYTLTNGTPPSFVSNTILQHRMPRLPEEADFEGGVFAENFGVYEATFHRRQQPPSLPPIPSGLTPEKIKRRHIIGSIIHSENNYVATLQRLVNEYKKPLEESKPPILNSNKLNILFHRIMEILQCHALFRIELTECARQWDRDEKMGDVFMASFSKAYVLEVYSDFINNFSRAIDLAKQESKKKSAFADFLKMRQITSNDRLSFFGLMVKPVQRFPQFILFLQDLLKHTPHGHHDRMSLQLALTQMESLAEMLNERKREAEQYQAFRETLKHINTKFALRGLGDGNRFLLRQNDVVQLEFNQNGVINKTKERRLFLTNDIVICVSIVPKSGDDFQPHSERLSLKWAYPVADVEITDTSSSPTLSRLLAAGMNRSTNSRIPEESFVGSESLVQEMNDLMHDYQIVSRISSLVGTLKGEYEGLTASAVNSISANIQRSIHQKDEQMAYIDACCLQFSIRTKEGKEKETFTFQTADPSVKKDWIVELRLAQLSLDKCNSPAWYLPEQDRRPSTKMPLFVKALPVYSSNHNTEVRCGCCYTVTTNRPSRSANRHLTYLWLCSSDGVSSHLTVFLIQQVGLREVVTVDLTEVCVSALQHVPALGPGLSGTGEDSPLKSHTIWMGTDSHRLLVYSGLDPERQTQLSATGVSASVTTIKYHCDQVYLGLANGSIQVYRRGTDGTWLFEEPLTIELGKQAVLSLLPISAHVYLACGINVHVIDCFTAQIMKRFEVQHESCGSIQLMAHSGIGLWIAQEQSSTICLYHTETFKHLQDINVASIVSKMLSKTGSTSTPAKIYVTDLIASKGLLWVGTNVGVALTIPLPRLEGVPLISGRANISFHAHLGPITFLLALQPQPGFSSIPVPTPDPRLVTQDNLSDARSSTVPPNPTAPLEKQQSDGSLLVKQPNPHIRQQLSSPVMFRRKFRESRDPVRRISKTLPRGLGNFSLGGSQECDVYRVCGALLNVQNYEEDALGTAEGLTNLSHYDSMRRSDPEIVVPDQVNTLDQKVRLKASRPRSLDLSTWSVDSRASSACTTISSGSEEGVITGGSTQTGQNIGINHKYISTAHSRRKDLDLPRTLLVVTGGRGYVNWNHSEPPSSLPNMKDAHIIVWEMKL